MPSLTALDARKVFVFLAFLIIPTLALAGPADNLDKGVFLIASKRWNDTGFEKAVIYITEHGQSGSYGLIVNRRTPVPLDEVIPESKTGDKSRQWVYFGGPMHSQFLFVVTRTQHTEGLHHVTQDIYFGAGKETIAARSAKKYDEPFRAYAGFASWGPGQLEEEIKGGAWVLAPGDPGSLFTEPSETLWQTLFDRWAGSWI